MDGIKVLFVGYIRVKDNRLNFFLFYFYFIFSFYFYFYLFLDLELGISMISHINITNCYMMCHSITQKNIEGSETIMLSYIYINSI